MESASGLSGRSSVWSEATVVNEFSVDMIGTTVPVVLDASILAEIFLASFVIPATVISTAMSTAITVIAVNMCWSLRRRAAS